MRLVDSTPSANLHHPSIPADNKRQPWHKEGHFLVKEGHRHHAHDAKKAPYPLSYDRQFNELEALDLRLVQSLRGSVSFVNFEVPPQRVLDLGCGTGCWAIEAAKEWPECSVVGFDLANIQHSLKIIEPSVAKRIEWKHGNFLTTKLPFDDDEFDHVHIQSIAAGVPENKWGMLFEEVNRVLSPEGSVEILEDDVIFPRLPRWFTSALRARPRRPSAIHLRNGIQCGYPSRQDTPNHDHALLELLNKSVYENRFINMKPTALLPSYFTTYFRQVTMGPVIHFPMPPMPPLQPLPPQIITTYVIEPNSDTLDARSSTIFPASSPPPPPVCRPISLSFSSSITGSVSSAQESSATASSYNGRGRTVTTSFSSQEVPSSFALSTTNSTISIPACRDKELPPRPFKRFVLDSSVTENETEALPISLLPVEQLERLDERSLAMHLYRSFQSILANQESMWEELVHWIRERKEALSEFGWEDDDELEELASRKKFERLIDRFKSDMYFRIGLWFTLTGMDWPFPQREPLTKAELIEEERMRQSLLEGQKYITEEDLQTTCRSVRVIVGYKL